MNAGFQSLSVTFQDLSIFLSSSLYNFLYSPSYNQLRHSFKPLPISATFKRSKSTSVGQLPNDSDWRFYSKEVYENDVQLLDCFWSSIYANSMLSSRSVYSKCVRIFNSPQPFYRYPDIYCIKCIQRHCTADHLELCLHEKCSFSKVYTKNHVYDNGVDAIGYYYHSSNNSI